jgi:hypothetical protein
VSAPRRRRCCQPDAQLFWAASRVLRLLKAIPVGLHCRIGAANSQSADCLGPLWSPTAVADRIQTTACTRLIRRHMLRPLALLAEEVAVAKIGSWWLKSVAAEPDEQVVWSQGANRIQPSGRAVGGKLFLTDRRLVFCPHWMRRSPMSPPSGPLRKVASAAASETACGSRWPTVGTCCSSSTALRTWCHGWRRPARKAGTPRRTARPRRSSGHPTSSRRRTVQSECPSAHPRAAIKPWVRSTRRQLRG